MVRTLGFHCQGPRFNHWSGNQDPTSQTVRPKKKKKIDWKPELLMALTNRHLKYVLIRLN